MKPEILEPSSESEAWLNSFLDARIYEFNVRTTGIGDGRTLCGAIKDDSGNVIAAINGHSWGGCCHITHLWVHESRRRQGIGGALLRSAEEEAVRRGCARSLVFTHSFQAPGFYERQGYVRQASIPNYPSGHALHGYLKELASE